jgi:hypothetical protein
MTARPAAIGMRFSVGLLIVASLLTSLGWSGQQSRRAGEAISASTIERMSSHPITSSKAPRLQPSTGLLANRIAVAHDDRCTHALSQSTGGAITDFGSRASSPRAPPA